MAQDPGLPVENPTISYWQLPPNRDVSDHRSEQLPEEVDIVIIGSGISGTSVAWHLLKEGNWTKDSVPRVAMLEARQACSGATGRNGGQIRPSTYMWYGELKGEVSDSEATKITTLVAGHVEALLSAADQLPEEGRLAAEARYVDSIDAFFDNEKWNTAIQQLETLKRDMPELGKGYEQFGGPDAQRISLLVNTVGIITDRVSAAIWPYRFITHALKMLLDDFPTFSLDTSTPAHNVSIIDSATVPHKYEVTTPRGTISTKHVVHASNAWTPQLVPGLREHISGVKLHMSAQIGGAGLPEAGNWPDYTGNGSLPTGRAWSFFNEELDYAVQMPRTGVYMFGRDVGLGTQNNTTDDSESPNHLTASYLNGALPNYFGYENWGTERVNTSEGVPEGAYPGRSLRVWTGIEGMSADELPIVGRLAESITTRKAQNQGLGGEWVISAFNGDGMCSAWLCGRALAQMISSNQADHVPDWFPTSYLATEKRFKSMAADSRSFVGRSLIRKLHNFITRR